MPVRRKTPCATFFQLVLQSLRTRTKRGNILIQSHLRDQESIHPGEGWIAALPVLVDLSQEFSLPIDKRGRFPKLFERHRGPGKLFDIFHEGSHFRPPEFSVQRLLFLGDLHHFKAKQVPGLLLSIARRFSHLAVQKLPVWTGLAE